MGQYAGRPKDSSTGFTVRILVGRGSTGKTMRVVVMPLLLNTRLAHMVVRESTALGACRCFRVFARNGVQYIRIFGILNLVGKGNLLVYRLLDSD